MVGWIKSALHGLWRKGSPCQRNQGGYQLNSSKTIVVSTDVFWNEDMTQCPRGAKVQLLGLGGVAQYSVYNGDSFWVKWAPLPRHRPKE